MIYICMKENCKFIFERFSEPDRCPDCGSSSIREASVEECQQYKQRMKEHSGRRQQ